MALCCPNHYPIRTQFLFLGSLLSESLSDSDSFSLFCLSAVRITIRFGLIFTFLALCCPNHYPIRTRFHFVGSLLSESPPNSDSISLFRLTAVRISTRFGLIFSFLYTSSILFFNCFSIENTSLYYFLGSFRVIMV
jgi:hypothetical protein